MANRPLDLMRPLKSSGAAAIAVGFVVATAVMEVSKSLVSGILGSLLDKINLSNDTGSFRLELGTILTTVLWAAVALAVMVFLLGRGDSSESG